MNQEILMCTCKTKLIQHTITFYTCKVHLLFVYKKMFIYIYIYIYIYIMGFLYKKITVSHTEAVAHRFAGRPITNLPA